MSLLFAGMILALMTFLTGFQDTGDKVRPEVQLDDNNKEDMADSKDLIKELNNGSHKKVMHSSNMEKVDIDEIVEKMVMPIASLMVDKMANKMKMKEVIHI